MIRLLYQRLHIPATTALQGYYHKDNIRKGGIRTIAPGTPIYRFSGLNPSATWVLPVCKINLLRNSVKCFRESSCLRIFHYVALLDTILRSGDPGIRL